MAQYHKFFKNLKSFPQFHLTHQKNRTKKNTNLFRMTMRVELLVIYSVAFHLPSHNIMCIAILSLVAVFPANSATTPFKITSATNLGLALHLDPSSLLPIPNHPVGHPNSWARGRQLVYPKGTAVVQTKAHVSSKTLPT
jgi:hypothetical protein